MVRVRVGSSFSQKGMSDTNYENESFIIPAAIEAVGKTDEYCELMRKNFAFYSELVKLGVPFQEARYAFPHASVTSLVWSVNLLSLKNFCMNRMCSTQSWEINTLCKLIKIEVGRVYPKIAKYLDSRCAFTKEYREMIRTHNLYVKPRNNYFLDKINAKTEDGIIVGKYDDELHKEKELIEQGYAYNKDSYTYKQIRQIKLKMMDISSEKKQNEIIFTKEENCVETKKDTYLDLLNYSIMFSYGLKKINISMFEGM